MCGQALPNDDSIDDMNGYGGVIAGPTPTAHGLPMRHGDFSTLTEALDYAARGETGYNFYDGKGQLSSVLPYAQLREDALAIARRLAGLNLQRGARVALVAGTDPGFVRLFYGCQYAGMVPVPMPASIRLGGHRSYVAQLRRLLLNCGADVAISPSLFLSFLTEAAEGLPLKLVGTPETLLQQPEAAGRLHPSGPDELAYLQYTSGSTRFPRGVMITHRIVMDNLGHIIRSGVKIGPEDRAVSWLPFYHDMGLVGLVLASMAAQMSVDFLCTRDFGMRPRLWLSLISRNRSTISFSPPFGYELCMKRLREDALAQFDLSSWRVAGVGAEMIRPEPLLQFADMLAPCGFEKRAFLACYGMAECSLAVSFSPLERGMQVDVVDADILADSRVAHPVQSTGGQPPKAKGFVNCGVPIAGHEVQVRDARGRVLPDRQVGTLFVKGPSVMSGYFGEKEVTRDVLSPDGWLNTGDLAYTDGSSLIITGRQKDVMILNGRNIWPQDLEYLAESQPAVRQGDASAFSATGADGAERIILVVECREARADRRIELVNCLQNLIREELGVDCLIELVPRNTLPRTTSGKLSRSGAKRDFLQRIADGKVDQPGIAAAIIGPAQPDKVSCAG